MLSTAATVAAAVLLCYSCIQLLDEPAQFAVLRQPSFDMPETFNDRLNQLQVILAPVEKMLPNVPLRYLSETEAHNEFDFVQAVLAPRRIGPDLDSPYILVLNETDKWLSDQQELKNARLLLQLPWQIRLYQMEGMK